MDAAARFRCTANKSLNRHAPPTILPPMSPASIPNTLPRAALVTGAGKRIGRTLALELGRNGFAVAVHYGHARADAEAVVAEIVKAGGKAVALGADLSVETQVSTLIAAAVKALGP